jgi:hypothetical protein
MSDRFLNLWQVSHHSLLLTNVSWKRQSQIERALRLIESVCPNPTQKIELLEQLYAWVRDSGLDRGDHSQFVGMMCRDEEFCESLAVYITDEHPSDEVASTLQVVLRNLRRETARYKNKRRMIGLTLLFLGTSRCVNLHPGHNLYCA